MVKKKTKIFLFYNFVSYYENYEFWCEDGGFGHFKDLGGLTNKRLKNRKQIRLDLSYESMVTLCIF